MRLAALRVTGGQARRTQAAGLCFVHEVANQSGSVVVAEHEHA
jgi:hypothetical protein